MSCFKAFLNLKLKDIFIHYNNIKMQRGNLLVNHQQFEPHFNEVSQNIIHEPCQERRCTDVFCLIVLFVALGGFFLIGAV